MGLLGVWCLVSTTVTFLVTLFVRHLLLRRKFGVLHGPRSYPLIGNAAQFKPAPEEFLDQMMGACLMFPGKARIISLWLAWKPCVMLYGADEVQNDTFSALDLHGDETVYRQVESVLNNNYGLEKGFFYKLLEPWLGTGLLTSPVSKWRPRRKQLTPTFHYDILRQFVDVFNKQTRVLMHKLEPLALHKRPFDVTGHVTLCTLDIICETAMGRCIDAQNDVHSDYVMAIYEINDVLQKRHLQPLMWSDWMFDIFGQGLAQKRCLRILHGFTKKVIEERRDEMAAMGGVDALVDFLNDNRNSNVQGDEKKRRLAFLDLLLGMVEKQQLSLEDVCMEVDTFMFEGHDTTSTSLVWILLLLGTNPAIQRRVQKELDDQWGVEGSDVSYDDLARFHYLECCIKESLRLYPSVPAFMRVTGKEQRIGKWDIPANTQVILNPYMVHRDPEHWPDPEIFNPDRFLPKNRVGRHPFAFLPFSAGGRNCIGQKFAILEEKTVLAWILHYFDVHSLLRRDQIRSKGEQILKPLKGLEITLKIRRPLTFD